MRDQLENRKSGKRKEVEEDNECLERQEGISRRQQNQQDSRQRSPLENQDASCVTSRDRFRVTRERE